MRIVYFANIIVAGWISISSLFFPAIAKTSVFSHAYAETEVMRLVGCLWLAIAILSMCGLFRPENFVVVFLVQLIYKSCWLLFVALPAQIENKPFPRGMAFFFLIWVVVLPFVIPWKHLLTDK